MRSSVYQSSPLPDLPQRENKMAKHLKEKHMTNKSYDILKWVALVALPATSAL